MFREGIDLTARYFEQGGWVMVWLAVVSSSLWFVLGYRLVATRQGGRRELYRFSRLSKALISVAPILGLLGTVGGMIETFDSLRDMDLFSQSGGIAGGISQALFTTQLGLAVSIPGLLVHGLVERRAQAREAELTRSRDIFLGAHRAARSEAA